MCEYCGLINAIDRYIEKAESKLEEVFEEEERANPKKMVRDISLIEKLVTGALLSETEYFIAEIRKKKNLKQVKESLKKINDGDKCFEVIKQKLKEEFRNIIEENAELYIKRTDSELRIKNLSKRTVNWVESWSGELANIMRLNSNFEIEEILRKGLKNGDGVDVFTRNILESGIRDEYYKARRVAVTEVLRAHNVAQQEAFMQDPSVSDKMWRHTGEYRNEPRQNHVDMDGQIVKKDEPFELIGKDGGVYYPMQPCDSSLPPEESVNCHCICQPVVNEETLGLSLEERQRLQQEAIDEMDDSWEKELDRKNREKWEERERKETDEREFEDNRKNGVDNFGGNGIIRVDKTEIRATPNSITEVVNKKGGIDRNYYDSEGKQSKQISNNDHGKPKQHPFGKNGEHAHDYIWEDGKLIGRPVRELTEAERKENGDVL